ncbi:pyridoxal phosphate-dependent aminotransferase [Alloscardovia theropitheci]|uniref:alanine transaminase n=1 Tax=Alloscardovia theropitheci TaxID=2496842 RepID=A0A4R0QN76_9BIFI|nr:pyridoxal phosphate-dependent aminotransferase [Alloscardovia theropitheci]TCD53604.1 pyridoxal phosphate-dependent aminotransferase [Alloscardovia theropitheci]
MYFSHRIEDTYVNALSQRSNELQGQGIAISHLNDSNPTHFGLSVHSPDFEYSASARGDERARIYLTQYLSKRYQRTLDEKHLYLLNSTSQAYAWLMMLLCDPGDYILYPRPGYPLIESICSLCSAHALPYHLEYDGSWMIDYVSIEEQLREHNGVESEHRIKAIVLINPNNPTGSYVKRQERERIIALCKLYDIAIITDEVFYDFSLDAFDDRDRLVGEKNVLTFALDGFSKMLAAPDAKVGWIYVSGPENDVHAAQKRLDMIADDFLPMSSYITREIPSLLERADAQSEKIRVRCMTNLTWLKTYTTDSNETQGIVSVLRTEGAWSALLRYPSSIDDDELGIMLLNKNHSMSAPGYFFDIETNGYMSVSLLPQSDTFEKVMKETIRIIESFIE